MTYFANPYPAGTQMYEYLEVLKDLKWHCAKCDLTGSQPAKPLQNLRNDGWEFERGGTNWDKRMYCVRCQRNTSHRRLVSLRRGDSTSKRSGFPKVVRDRIVEYYDGKDELLGYAPTGRAIEIDHRVPQVRWHEDEDSIDPAITDQEIEQQYMLLVREHNLLKSRRCEKCVETGVRQPLLGIEFFYVGTREYTEPLGCEGCGWHNPRRWKAELNARLHGLGQAPKP